MSEPGAPREGSFHTLKVKHGEEGAKDIVRARIDGQIDVFLKSHEGEGLELHSNKTEGGVFMLVAGKSSQFPFEFADKVVRYLRGDDKKGLSEDGWGRGDCYLIANFLVREKLADGYFSARDPDLYEQDFRFHVWNYKQMSDGVLTYDATAGYNLDLGGRRYYVLGILAKDKVTAAEYVKDFLKADSIGDFTSDDVAQWDAERDARIAKGKAEIDRLNMQIEQSRAADRLERIVQREYGVQIMTSGNRSKYLVFLKRLEDELKALQLLYPDALKKAFKNPLSSVSMSEKRGALVAGVTLYSRFNKRYEQEISLDETGAFTSFIKEFATKRWFF